MNELPKDIKSEYTNITEFVRQASEEYDSFVFKTVLPWLKGATQYRISKQILKRAIECFVNEHPTEYKALMEQMEEREQ